MSVVEQCEVLDNIRRSLRNLEGAVDHGSIAARDIRRELNIAQDSLENVVRNLLKEAS